jgi:hypothetical protein
MCFGEIIQNGSFSSETRDRSFRTRRPDECGEHYPVGDFEQFNLLHVESRRTGAKRLPVASGVTGITGAKAVSGTGNVCAAVLIDANARKDWTAAIMTIDCFILFPAFNIQDVPLELWRLTLDRIKMILLITLL